MFSFVAVTMANWKDTYRLYHKSQLLKPLIDTQIVVYLKVKTEKTENSVEISQF